MSIRKAVVTGNIMARDELADRMRACRVNSTETVSVRRMCSLHRLALSPPDRSFPGHPISEALTRYLE